MSEENSKLKVLQAFKRYLPISLNWAYRLVDSTSGIEHHVFAQYFEKNNFYSSKFRFVDLGYPNMIGFHKSLGRTWSDGLYKMLVKVLLALIQKKHSNLLAKYIKDNRIDIIHSHFAPFACKMSEIIEGSDVKHVVSFYGFDYEQLPFKYPIFVDRYNKLFRSAAAFICEGSHGVETLLKMGCPRDKLHIVRLGLNPSQISFGRRIKNQNGLKLLQIATLTEKKGHYYTIRAFLKALKTSPQMTLTIVGSPKSKGDVVILDDIIDQIRIHNAEDKVKIVSGIDYSMLYSFMNDYDVFIHPSCYARDMDCEGGAPVVILDCQATGMPVISTTHCDIPDEVIHGHTGLLSPEKDIDSLAKNIEAFYHMPNEEFATFSLSARKHIELNFNIEQSGRILSGIYSGMMKTHV